MLLKGHQSQQRQEKFQGVKKRLALWGPPAMWLSSPQGHSGQETLLNCKS